MRTIVVGMGTCGLSAGARQVYDRLEELTAEHPGECELTLTGCIGMCFREPLWKYVTSSEGPSMERSARSPLRRFSSSMFSEAPELRMTGSYTPWVQRAVPQGPRELPRSPGQDSPEELRNNQPRFPGGLRKSRRLQWSQKSTGGNDPGGHHPDHEGFRPQRQGRRRFPHRT